jgi:hypothetical protein
LARKGRPGSSPGAGTIISSNIENIGVVIPPRDKLFSRRR